MIAGADFFTTEVWTWRGLVTYYTVFVIDLASRRVQVLGSTPHPTELFMDQATRKGTAADDGLLVRHRGSVIAIGNGVVTYEADSPTLAFVWY